MKRVFLILLLLVVSVYADDSFGDLYLVFEDWIQGNLGKLLALIGFVIIFLTYTFSIQHGEGIHKLLINGGFLCVISGGIIGITNTFFNLGGSTFSIIP
ncbi:hypothetical protein [Aliarcobacter butzleri]|uniref:hypothetical protein n=1 Tax=Aliarcobacter butzleri TaxID=28197 RepID=UPI003B216B15